MADFFINKVTRIRQDLDKIQETLPKPVESQVSASSFKCFNEVSQQQVKKILMSSPSSTCALDPIPTNLLKESIDVLLPVITTILNRSLKETTVPDSFKSAIVTPLLKKDNLDPEIYKNYRPISNLPFLSKVLERVVAQQLNNYTEAHPHQEIMQSAYRRGHSTETALVKIQNDILNEIDNQRCVFLVLLDLSAAFDTVDHDLLLSRLKHRFGISDDAHSWIISYLKNRNQCVLIDGVKSKCHVLKCNVPQGSVLGPKFFKDYESPVGDIIRSFGLTAHFYADDTQLYISFAPGVNEEASFEKVEACIAEVRSWMASNYLKLNDDKTEFIVLGSNHHLQKVQKKSVSVGGISVSSSSSVRNIGAIFDSQMKMDKQVSAICKSAWFHLHQLSKIRKYLSAVQTKTVIQAFVTSKLDQNNSLLAGLPDCQIMKIQRVQNCAAKLIFRAKKNMTM